MFSVKARDDVHAQSIISMHVKAGQLIQSLSLSLSRREKTVQCKYVQRISRGYSLVQRRYSKTLNEFSNLWMLHSTTSPNHQPIYRNNRRYVTKDGKRPAAEGPETGGLLCQNPYINSFRSLWEALSHVRVNT